MTISRATISLALMSISILFVACGGGGGLDPGPRKRPSAEPLSSTTKTTGQRDSVVSTMQTIPGLHAVDVHGNFTNRGFTLSKDLHPEQSVWRCTDETGQHMMLVEAFGQPTELTMVRGTYSNYTNEDTDAAAKSFLGYVASVTYDGSEPEKARAWVEANVGSNATTTIGSVSFELIRSAPRVRMLLIEPDAVAAQRTPSTNPVAAESNAKAEDRLTSEQRAASRLRLAKQLLERQPESGKRWLEELVTEYPATEAAQEAQAILDDLP